MSVNELYRIVYSEWFVLLLVTYIAFALTYLIYRQLPHRNNKALKMFLLSITVGLGLFYFVIPVPDKVQQDFINQVLAIKIDNKHFRTTHMELKKREICPTSYLNATEFFIINNGFTKDMKEAISRQGLMMITPHSNHISTSKSICGTSF